MRALERDLPEAVTIAVVDILYGPLPENPYRVGKPLRLVLERYWAARRGQYGSSTPSTTTGSWSASCASPTDRTCTADAITDRSARATEAVCVCSVSPLGHRTEGLAVTDRQGTSRRAGGLTATVFPQDARRAGDCGKTLDRPRPGRRCGHAIDTTFVHAHHVGRRARPLVGRGPVRIRRRRAATLHDVAGRSRTHARPGPVARRRSATPPPDGGPGSSPDPRRIRRAP